MGEEGWCFGRKNERLSANHGRPKIGKELGVLSSKHYVKPLKYQPYRTGFRDVTHLVLSSVKL